MAVSVGSLQWQLPLRFFLNLEGIREVGRDQFSVGSLGCVILRKVRSKDLSLQWQFPMRFFLNPEGIWEVGRNQFSVGSAVVITFEVFFNLEGIWEVGSY